MMRALLLLLFTLPSLASVVAQPPASPVWVATIPPLASIVSEITKGRGTVSTLLPLGASPHTYEPRPSDARLAESATALFHIYPEIDGWAVGLPTPQRVAVLPMLPREFLIVTEEECKDPIAAHMHTTTNADSGSHAHSVFRDPHFWTDPLAVAAVVVPLSEQIAEIDPAGAATYKVNATAYIERLKALHAELEITLSPTKGRSVLLFHNSFRYMAERYGFEVAGVIEQFPGREASPRELAAIIQSAHLHRVRAIFREPQLPPRAAIAIGEATGLPVFELDPEGATKDRADLMVLLRHNAAILKKALE